MRCQEEKSGAECLPIVAVYAALIGIAGFLQKQPLPLIGKPFPSDIEIHEGKQRPMSKAKGGQGVGGGEKGAGSTTPSGNS